MGATASRVVALVVIVVAGRLALYDAVSSVILLLSAALFFVLYHVFVYPFLLSPLRHLPEPEGASFPWAHAASLKNSAFHGDALRAWTRDTPNAGLIRFRVLWNQERLLLTSDQALKEVLVTKSYQFVKPDDAGFLFIKLLGNGVLVAEGDEHKRQRKALLPAFAFRHVKELYPLFWAKAKQSTDEIAKVYGPQSAYERASHVTLDIIGQSGIGHDFNAVTEPDGDIVSEYRKLFSKDEAPGFRWIVLGIPVPIKLLFQLPLPEFTDAKKSAAFIREFAADVVRQKRRSFEKDKTQGLDIMSIAMTSGQFSDSELVDQMMTFLAAGHETTASALTWATWLLCRHPEVQQRLRDEVRSNIDWSASIDSATIDRLPYLNAVVSEVLRFIPTVPLSIRVATEDTTVLDQPIPKGTTIFLAPWATNLDPQLWSGNIDDFDPERWIHAETGSANSAGGARNNYANLTFLHGPRSCIGKDFARSEFLCILAAWVGRFEMTWTNESVPMEPVGWVTSHPRHRMNAVFKEVPGWA